MNGQNLFDGLRRRLAAKGVSAPYVDRLLEELQLHFQASVDRHLLSGFSSEQAETAALARLGTEQEIVRATLHTLRRESFVGRHRILCMMVAPPLLVTMARLLVVYLFLFGFQFLIRGFPHIYFRISRFQGPLDEMMCNLLVPLLFISAFWRLGRRKFCGTGYTMVGCCLLTACSLWIQVKHRAAGMPRPPHSWVPSAYQTALLSIYCILLIAWLIRRNRQITA